MYCACLQVPLDGRVVWGSANVSLQHISGESVPVRLSPGDEVPAGSLNLDGALVVRVTCGVEDSTPARIARMAAQAQVSGTCVYVVLERHVHAMRLVCASRSGSQASALRSQAYRYCDEAEEAGGAHGVLEWHVLWLFLVGSFSDYG
jgi:hypothetical protein